MKNITDLDTQRPHSTTSITCLQCRHNWIAVYITGTKALECPGCHRMVNEFGAEVLAGRCEDCGSEYTVVPKPEKTEDWQSCLSIDCPSYDPERDVDNLFDGDGSEVIRKPVKSGNYYAYAVVDHGGIIDFVVTITNEITSEHAKMLCHDHINNSAGHGVEGCGQWVVRPVFIGTDAEAMRFSDNQEPKE